MNIVSLCYRVKVKEGYASGLCSSFFCLLFCVCMAPSTPPNRTEKSASAAFRLSEYVDHRAVPVSLVMMVVAQSYGCIQAFT